MSKIFAKSYMYTRGIDKDEFRHIYSKIQPKVKYLSKTKEFHFKTFDVISYLTQKEITTTSFKVPESLITRFFRMDQLFEGAPLEEIDYKFIKKKETEDLDDFYDDAYYNLCFLQFYYFLSKDILKLVKRQLHIYRLNRADEPWFHLTLIPINRNGGRRVGGKFGEPSLSKEEKEILLENLSRYDQIIAKYAASEVSLDKFIYMHKQLAKLGNLLPDYLQKSFMRKEEALTWYWHAIRYNYKKQHGLILTPTLDEIRAAQEKFGFPWEEE